jgi:hypothetical protein
MKAEATLIVNDAVSLPMTGDLVDMITALKGSPPQNEQAGGVLQSLFARFEVLEEKKLGGTLLRHLLDEPRPPVIIDMLCTFEAALVDAGAIPSEWNLLAARKRGASVRPISRPLPAIKKTLDPAPDAQPLADAPDAPQTARGVASAAAADRPAVDDWLDPLVRRAGDALGDGALPLRGGERHGVRVDHQPLSVVRQRSGGPRPPRHIR